MHSSQGRGYKGIGMEGRIATWYARNTANDLGEFQSLAERLAREVPAGSRILEVAPGPGYLAVEIAKRGQYVVTGLDISKTFVEIATANASRASVKVDFQHGNASAMPFADDTFDLIVCRAAFKNFSQPLEAMQEMHRVLKPRGRALIIDLRKDASMEDINAYIKDANLGWANSLIYKATFRYLLIPRAYSKRQFVEMAASSRFGGAEISGSGIGFEITLRKCVSDQ
jgi:ubiquinone/menaquinone biosynthesis C-methylase UbiE